MHLSRLVGGLQPARDRRAVDQRREARGQVDAAVVHDLPRKRRPAPTPCAGVQPRQLPPHAGLAGRDRAVVSEHAAREGGEDRREGDRARPLPRLPDGGSRRAARAVRPPPRPNRQAAAPRRGAMLTRPGHSALPVEGRRASAAEPTTALWPWKGHGALRRQPSDPDSGCKGPEIVCRPRPTRTTSAPGWGFRPVIWEMFTQRKGDQHMPYEVQHKTLVGDWANTWLYVDFDGRVRHETFDTRKEAEDAL